MRSNIKHDNAIVSAQPMTFTNIASYPHLVDCHRPNATCHSFFHYNSLTRTNPVMSTFLSYKKWVPNWSICQPRITHFHWSNNLHLAANGTHNTRHPILGYLPTDITYLHMQKTGGTTVHHAIGHFSRFIQSHLKWVRWHATLCVVDCYEKSVDKKHNTTYNNSTKLNPTTSTLCLQQWEIQSAASSRQWDKPWM